MNPKIVSIDAKANAPKERLQLGQLKRIVLMACEYRAKLAMGLAATALFACLHTITLAGAFPVFKLLLEEEGLNGWAYRTIAGQRLGADFAPAVEGRAVRVLAVAKKGPLSQTEIKPGDEFFHAHESLASGLLYAIAMAKDGGETVVHLGAPDSEDDQQQRRVTLHPLPLNWTSRSLSWIAGFIPDDSKSQKLQLLTKILFGLVVVVVLANICRYLGEVLIAEAILRAMMTMRTELFDRTLRLPMAFFVRQPTSDLVGRFVQDIQEIQRGLLTLFSKFIREPLRVVMIIGGALWLDWRITLALVVVTPPVLLIFWRVGKSVKKSNRKLLQAYGDMIGALTTSLQNLRVVKAYTAEKHEQERLREVDRRVLRQQLKLARLQAFVSPMMETVAVVTVSFLTVWLAGRVLSDDLSTSKFATLGVMLAVLFDPVRKLTDVYVRVVRSTAGAERIFQVIDEPTESELAQADVELPRIQSAIEYKQVNFTYPGAQKPALREIDLTIRKGETVAIVGPNGSGKTTLVSLLPRFFDPDSGTITFDGIDIRRATLDSLRAQIGLVTQDAIIFAGTPAENIAYGQKNPKSDAIAQAATRASADEFIGEIPGGYQGSIGEGGKTLSGGQRQRLAIARAIYRDAPILVFDEATSQIDTESEVEIQEALRAFAKGRTTLIIAHRLSTIQFADRIVVMDKGRVIDTGVHAELFDRCEVYRTLCETQFVSAPVD